jgi:uncharacterized protein (AIM24 family)
MEMVGIVAHWWPTVGAMTHPANWYPDPAGDVTLLRYWDGSAWTEHTQPAPSASGQPAPPQAAPSQPAAPEQPPVSNDQPVQRTASSGDAIAGIRSDLLSGEYAETTANQRVVLQNPKLLKVRLGEPVLARQGAMVAFQGSIDFEHEGSGGLGKFLKKAATGEGVPLMRCVGQGEVFLAHDADQVHILHLEGSALSVNGKNILAFEPSLEWDIQRVQGAGVLTGGLFNTRLSGHGWVAITTKGQPVVLHTDQPTFGDPDAVVAWSANLTTSLNKTVKAKAMIGLGSGEAFQVAFQGQGIVIVQPSEGGVVPPHTH